VALGDAYAMAEDTDARVSAPGSPAPTNLAPMVMCSNQFLSVIEPRRAKFNANGSSVPRGDEFHGRYRTTLTYKAATAIDERRGASPYDYKTFNERQVGLG